MILSSGEACANAGDFRVRRLRAATYPQGIFEARMAFCLMNRGTWAISAIYTVSACQPQ